MALNKEIITANGVKLQYHKIHSMSVTTQPIVYLRKDGVDETGFDDIRQIGTETVFYPDYETHVDEETGKEIRVRVGEHTEEVPKMQRNQYNISVSVRSYTSEDYRNVGENNYVTEEQIEIPVRKANLEIDPIYRVAYNGLKATDKFSLATDC